MSPWDWTVNALSLCRPLKKNSAQLGIPNVRRWEPSGKQIAAMRRAVLTPAELAEEFKVTYKTVYAWYKRNNVAYKSLRKRK